MKYEVERRHMPQAEWSWRQPLAPPPLDLSVASHRQLLVSKLFKRVREIQPIDHGYAFRFHKSGDLEDLLQDIAEYIVFESLNSAELTFTIVEEPKARAFWLQVRGPVGVNDDGSLQSVPFNAPVLGWPEVPHRKHF